MQLVEDGAAQAAALGRPAASAAAGVGFAELDADTDERFGILGDEEQKAKPAKTFRFYPKVYKAAIAAL